MEYVHTMREDRMNMIQNTVSRMPKKAIQIYFTVYKCGIYNWYNTHFLRMHFISNITNWYYYFFLFIFVQNQYKFLYHALYESFRTGCRVLKKENFVQEMETQMKSDKATNLSNFRTEFKVNLFIYYTIVFVLFYSSWYSM